MLLPLLVLLGVDAARYNTSSKRRTDALNVHIVCHTHDDVGWLKTYTQYYYGSNNTYEPTAGGVQFILDSVVTSLAKNKDRVFSYAEQAFFQRWYEQQDPETVGLVKKLVHDEQLQFINGGWVMHDEATTHFVGMVDQTTYGHTKLMDNFGVVPKVGWQIDPFGHSSTQASLLSAEVGFDALFFARIDYQDFAKREAAKDLEFMWQASESNPNSSIFTGVFAGHQSYGFPLGFCFDMNLQCVFSKTIIDDVTSPDYNVKSFVDLFVKTAHEYQGWIQGNDVMFLMGSDFFYDNAERWFKNLDKLIHYVNLDGRVNAMYSSPEIYAHAKLSNQSHLKYSVKTDDFFPYADNKNSYWTGYFTSRPALKRLERVSSGYLQNARFLEVQAALQPAPAFSQPLDALERAVAILQHHDGVSGTSKQHVAYDYALRVSKAMDQADAFLSTIMANLTKNKMPAAFCRLLNETVCNITTTSDSLVVVLHNVRAHSYNTLIRFPVKSANLQVRNGAGVLVPFQIVNESIPLMIHRNQSNVWRLMLSFEVLVPTMGFATFFVVPPQHEKQQEQKAPDSFQPSSQDTITIENTQISATFSSLAGGLVSLTNMVDGVKVAIKQEWLHYISAEPEFDGITNQSSGAYIFRPSTKFPNATPIEGKRTITFNKGSSVQEVRIEVSPWITQIFRLPPHADHLEVEMTVGPVPTEKCDNLCGLEVISRYSTDIDSGDLFWTDSNGLEMQKRKRNFRPTWNLTVEQPVAGNYYPVNVAASLRDTSRDLTVVVDRSLGAASLSSGQLELMIHRRIHFDDIRGVTEFLDETEGGVMHWPILAKHKGPGLVIVTKHLLSLSSQSLGLAAPRWRSMAQAAFTPFIPAFYPLTSSVNDYISTHNTQQGLFDLPYPAHLMTFQLLSHTQGHASVRIRLLHSFAISECDSSQRKNDNCSVSVDLTEIFRRWDGVKVAGVRETSLTGNQDRGSVEVGPIILNPMQIRTFTFDLQC